MRPVVVERFPKTTALAAVQYADTAIQKLDAQIQKLDAASEREREAFFTLMASMTGVR